MTSNRIGCGMIAVLFLSWAAVMIDRMVVEAGWATVLIIAGGTVGIVAYVWIAVGLMLRKKR